MLDELKFRSTEESDENPETIVDERSASFSVPQLTDYPVKPTEHIERNRLTFFEISFIGILASGAITILVIAGWLAYDYASAPEYSQEVGIQIEAIRTGDREEAFAAVQALAALRTEAYGAVPELLDISRDFDALNRDFAIMALGAIGLNTQSAISELSDMMSDSDPNIRLAAVIAVDDIGIGAQSAVPALTERLLTDPDAAVAARAAQALGNIGSSDVDSLVALALALDNANEEIRANAALALGQIGHDAEDSKGRLSQLAQVETTPYVRARAAWAAAVVDPSSEISARELILPLLQDPGDTARSLAIQQVAVIAQQDPAAIAILTDALTNNSPMVRIDAATALSTLPEPKQEIVHALVPVLEDSDVEVRRAAARALGSLEALAIPAAPKLMVALDDPDEKMQRESYNALKTIYISSERSLADVNTALNEHPLHGELCGHH